MRTSEYVDYDNAVRPHEGQQQTLITFSCGPATGVIACRDVSGGILRDYQRQAPQRAASRAVMEITRTTGPIHTRIRAAVLVHFFDEC